MQRPKLVDNATAGLKFQDSSTAAALDGTIVRSIFQNDNFDNLFNLVINAGYDLIDDDLSQVVKAVRGEYNATFTYNTSTIATQSVNDIVLGSDGIYYEVQSDAVSGDNPVGSVTGDWIVADLDFVTRIRKTVTHNIASDANYTLTVDQNTYGRIIITDTGVTLTAARNIVVDNIQKSFIVQNDTLQTLTFKTSGGTGIAVLAGSFVELYNDGTNVIILSQEVGVNQTSQDVTGSRSLSTVYTNTTGKPIEIIVSSIMDNSVQGVFRDGAKVAQGDADGTTVNVNTVIIPDGITYEVRAASFVLWVELR